MLLLVVCASAVHVAPWMNTVDPPAQRAQALLAQMTLQEKIVMLHGPESPMYVSRVIGLLCVKHCSLTMILLAAEL
jgi:hypothetical protein